MYKYGVHQIYRCRYGLQLRWRSCWSFHANIQQNFHIQLRKLWQHFKYWLVNSKLRIRALENSHRCEKEGLRCLYYPQWMMPSECSLGRLCFRNKRYLGDHLRQRRNACLCRLFRLFVVESRIAIHDDFELFFQFLVRSVERERQRYFE